MQEFKFDEASFDTADNLRARGHDIQSVEVKVAEPTEVCGNSNHGWKARMKCVLPKGHNGNHEDSVGCWWR
jgi:hypothetical protein